MYQRVKNCLEISLFNQLTAGVCLDCNANTHSLVQHVRVCLLDTPPFSPLPHMCVSLPVLSAGGKDNRVMVWDTRTPDRPVAVLGVKEGEPRSTHTGVQTGGLLCGVVGDACGPRNGFVSLTACSHQHAITVFVMSSSHNHTSCCHN